jgi:putative Holliday junction resolvase
MGLDVGEVRIGVALSDETGLIAGGLATLQRTGERKDVEALSVLIAENNVEHVVVGYPVNMDGSEGVQAERVRDFTEKLRAATPARISLWDERLSSSSASQVLIEGGVRRAKRKQVIDKLAAVIILQSFLDHHNAAPDASSQTEDHGGK